MESPGRPINGGVDSGRRKGPPNHLLFHLASDLNVRFMTIVHVATVDHEVT